MYNPGIFREWSERRFLLSRNIPEAAPQGLIKSKGGLMCGRGISDSTMERFTGSLPATVPICESLETCCDVITGSS